MEKIEFDLKEKDVHCTIFSGNLLEKEILDYLKKMGSSKYVIITDSKVNELHAQSFLSKMKGAGLNCFLISFPEGEKNKNRQTKAMLEDKMFEEKCGRDSCIIAFGGGVTGDMAGFVAGTYMRGIPIIQIPTTTIAIADSSIGGKTAIDVPAGKNLIGVFHQPIAIFMDTNYLKTLDKRNYVSGLIEIIKHGLIMDKEFYEFLKENIATILSRKGKDYERIMEKLMMNNLKIKRDIVLADEKEKALRKILNYGHTVGHAIEKLSDFSLLHGEAIAIGICVEAFIAYKKGILTKEDYLEQKQIINTLGLETQIPQHISTDKIFDLMRIDKKARNSMPEIVLLKSIGNYALFENEKVTKRFDEDEMKKIIDEYREEK